MKFTVSNSLNLKNPKVIKKQILQLKKTSFIINHETYFFHYSKDQNLESYKEREKRNTSKCFNFRKKYQFRNSVVKLTISVFLFHNARNLQENEKKIKKIKV